MPETVQQLSGIYAFVCQNLPDKGWRPFPDNGSTHFFYSLLTTYYSLIPTACTLSPMAHPVTQLR